MVCACMRVGWAGKWQTSRHPSHAIRCCHVRCCSPTYRSEVPAASCQHAAVGQQREAVAEPRDSHAGRGRGGVGGRVEQLAGCGARRSGDATATNKHLAGGQQHRLQRTIASHGQWRHQRPGASGRRVALYGGWDTGAADRQHVAVGEAHGGKLGPPVGEAAGLRPRVRAGVVQVTGGKARRPHAATHHQHAAVEQRHGVEQLALEGEVAGGGPGGGGARHGLHV